jgi:hypothetical protein
MAVLVDDATHPLDNDAVVDPASQGAAEFRALKAKLNSLFLNTGVNTSGPNLVTLNTTGLYSNYSAGPIGLDKIIYGFVSNVTRTGGTAHTVGGQFSGYLAPGIIVDPGEVFGVVSQAVSDPASQASLVASEFAVASFHAGNTHDLIGMNVVFKNRNDGAASPTSGLSTNLYNTHSKAIWISSQPRGATGEYCGWKDGIVYDEFSMDLAGGVAGNALDFYPIHYNGVANVIGAYRIDACIRMRSFQNIMWDDGGSPQHKTRLYVDPSIGRLVIVQETVGVSIQERWGVDLATGQVYKNGILQY